MAHFQLLGLLGKDGCVHAREDNATDFLLRAPLHHLTGVREDGDLLWRSMESGAEGVLEAGDWDSGENFFVKLGIGEAKALAEFRQLHRASSIFFKHHIGGEESGREIVDQGAGPVEEEILIHK